MSDSATIFTGSSRYSNDLQSVITRAVKIASLPLTQLNNVRSTLDAQSSALNALDQAFTNLTSAIQGLESSLGTASYSSTSSTAGVVRATVGAGATEGVYQIEVTSLGAYSIAMSKEGLTRVTDPSAGNSSADSTFKLIVDGAEREYTGFYTLNALAAAINADSGAGVQATIVNLGSSANPDYRLSLQSKRLDSVAVQLTDSESNPLLDMLATGSRATYKVNGMATEVSSDSRTITLAPGLTVDLIGVSQPGQATSITVSRSTLAMQNALASFAVAYNAAVTELDKHRGQNGGALAGDSIVTTLQQVLRSVAGYSAGADGVSSLTALGLSFDKNGQLSFDASAFVSAVENNYQALSEFMGSSAAGGFLKSANEALTMAAGTSGGILATAKDSVAGQIKRQDAAIDEMQDRITLYELSLNKQMADADALIAQLEQQVNYITGLFSAMKAASESMQ